MKSSVDTVCHEIIINRHGRAHHVRLPVWLPKRGWSITPKGYVFWSSRSPRIKRGTRAHRLTVETLTGSPLPDSIHVHHIDGNTRNCCPMNLCAMPAEFNPRSTIRDPFNGQFLSLREYRRRYARPNAA